MRIAKQITKARERPYPPSVRLTTVNLTQGAELFITLRTNNCGWAVQSNGGCKFCGLSKLDGERRPLSTSEAREQMKEFFGKFKEDGGKPKEVLKASIISMSGSVLSPETVEFGALKEAVKISHEKLPRIREMSFESRMDMVEPTVLVDLRQFLEKLFVSVASEVAVGIETPYEKVRDMMNKGISDEMIEKAAVIMKELDWKMRGYFIYNLLEFNKERLTVLKDSVDFMAKVRDKTKVNLSILLLRGYAPKNLKGTELFKDFRDIKDDVAIQELRAAAFYSKEKGIKFEIDSTSEDQAAADAKPLSAQYRKALERYNLTLNPEDLF